MALQITGKIEMIGEIVSLPSKNGGQPFLKREFVIDATRFNPETGEPWENHPKFELSGQRVNLIDQFEVGQKVVVDFSLRGAKWADQQTGEIKYFTSVSAFGIALASQVQIQQTNQQPVQNAQPVQMQQVAQPVNENHAPSVEEDDLPF